MVVALPLLRACVGSTVNIGSIEGIGANPNHAAYAASKGALHALSWAVAIDHGAEGIRCNVVAPGWIDTEQKEEILSQHRDQSSFRSALHAIHPLARTGKTQGVAALVAWLASD